ncbi:hypothetical protein FOA52_012428 [Chlamydomonas sp. UWO 241]|nr:hypothetical protein FOA52_012428 [Chlamydomonas sp. UWO 241]
MAQLRSQDEEADRDTPVTDDGAAGGGAKVVTPSAPPQRQQQQQDPLYQRGVPAAAAPHASIATHAASPPRAAQAQAAATTPTAASAPAVAGGVAVAQAPAASTDALHASMATHAASPPRAAQAQSTATTPAPSPAPAAAAAAATAGSPFARPPPVLLPSPPPASGAGAGAGAAAGAGAGASPAHDVSVGSVTFADGSTYNGILKGGLPDGLGTCSWSDGSSYDGEWRRGLMHGYGTFLWPSGQRYDGEWKDGFRDGIGVKRYADGSTFDGFWRSGAKNGVGVFRPASSADRAGASASQLPQALVLSNMPAGAAAIGHEVQAAAVQSLGQLGTTATTAFHDLEAGAERLARLAGQAELGALAQIARLPLVGSGEQATGAADAGAAGGPVPSGAPPVEASAAAAAVFATHGDATKATQGNGSAASAAPLEAHTPEVGAAAAVAAPIPPMRSLQTESMVSVYGAAGVGAPPKKEVFIRKFADGVLVREDKLSRDDIKLIFGDLAKDAGDYGKGKEKLGDKSSKKALRRVRKALGIPQKLQQKKGQLLYKGMPGYELMVRLQLGIRYSVGLANRQLLLHGQAREAAADQVSLKSLVPADFVAKTKVLFPSAGSTRTPAHPSSDFKWIDYSPDVFRNMRNMWGVHDAEYMLSLGASSKLWQLNSPGKSGCLFFLSDCDKFIIKSTTKAEAQKLVAMLPAYYNFVCSNPGTLCMRFYGVHGVKQVHGRTVRFLVMSNMFHTDLQIHRKFDLKGSWHGRTVGDADPDDLKTVFKDLDWDLQLRLPPEQHAKLITQLKKDSEFLRAAGVMDYSLLIGVHFCHQRPASLDGGPAPLLGVQPSNTAAGLSKRASAGIGAVASVHAAGPLAAAAAAVSAAVSSAAAALGVGSKGGHSSSAAHAPSAGSTGASAAASGACGAPPPQPLPPQPSRSPAGPGGGGIGRGASAGGGAPAVAPQLARAGSSGGGGPTSPFAIDDRAATAAAAVAHFALPPSLASEVSSSHNLSGRPGQFQAAPLLQPAGSSGLENFRRLSPSVSRRLDAALSGSGAQILIEPASLSQQPQQLQQDQLQQLQQPQQDQLQQPLQLQQDQLQQLQQPQQGLLQQPQQAAQQATQHQQAAAGGAGTGGGARNFEMFSSRVNVDRRLAVIEARMREHPERYSADRISDVLALYKLRILGDTLRMKSQHDSKPAAVLDAMQRWRQELRSEHGVSPSGVATSGPSGANSAPSFGSAPGLGPQRFSSQLEPTAEGHEGGESEDAGSLAGTSSNAASPRASGPRDGQSGGRAQMRGREEPLADRPFLEGHLGFGIPAVAMHRTRWDGGETVEPNGKGGKDGKGGAVAKDGKWGSKWARLTGKASKADEAPKDDGGSRTAEIGNPEEVILFVGIIDVLQDYNVRKLFERGIKGVLANRDAISVAPPGLYAKRFFDFLGREVFVEDTPPALPHAHPCLGAGPGGGRPHHAGGPSIIVEEGDDDDEDLDGSSYLGGSP